PVVNDIVYGWKDAPAVSFKPEVTSNVYVVLGSSSPDGVATIASPPPEVLSTVVTASLSLARYSLTFADVSVLASMPAPGVGRRTSAATNASRGTDTSPFAGRDAVTLGRALIDVPGSIAKLSNVIVSAGPSFFATAMIPDRPAELKKFVFSVPDSVSTLLILTKL